MTGGDSGIGHAVAIAFAKEGADVAIAYLEEHSDAEETAELVREEGRRCLLPPGDLASREQCRTVVDETVREFGGLDVLVNNVATQQELDSPEDLTGEQWMRTFDVNIHSYFRVTRAALPHLGEGAAIVNTASVNGLRGNKSLIDYSATKGAVIAWTYAMAQALAGRGIRVNAVAPGPVWTPLIPATLSPGHVAKFGQQCRWGARRSRTSWHRPMCSSRRAGCRRTTPVRCSPRSAARPFRGDHRPTPPRADSTTGKAVRVRFSEICQMRSASSSLRRRE